MQKWLMSSGTGLIIAFFLFSFMAYLVRPPTSTLTGPTIIPDVKPLAAQRQIKTEVKKPKALPEPKPVKKPLVVQPSMESAGQNNTDIEMLGHDPLDGLTAGIGAGGGLGKGLAPFNHQNNSFAQAAPIIKVLPQYPIEAAKNGTEGYVIMSFSIDENGKTTNITFVESEPARVFNRAAKNALKRWRYQTKFVEGLPIMQHNQVVRLDFALEDNQ